MPETRKVIVVGTSHAVVLGNPLCRLQGITRYTKVKLTVEDDRIVLTPLRETTSFYADRKRLKQLLVRLLTEYGMKSSDYDRLRHEQVPWMDFVKKVDALIAVDPVTGERLAKCLQRRLELERIGANESWPDTVNHVLHATANNNATSSDATSSDATSSDVTSRDVTSQDRTDT